MKQADRKILYSLKQYYECIYSFKIYEVRHKDIACLNECGLVTIEKKREDVSGCFLVLLIINGILHVTKLVTKFCNYALFNPSICSLLLNFVIYSYIVS